MADDPRKIARLAAAMAISNYGHLGLNVSVDEVLETRWKWSDSAESEVCSLAGRLMECDDHEVMFCQEARSWEKTITGYGLRGFADLYPHHKEWIEKLIDTELPS